MILDNTRNNITNKPPNPADFSITRTDNVFDIVNRRVRDAERRGEIIDVDQNNFGNPLIKDDKKAIVKIEKERKQGTSVLGLLGKAGNFF